MFDTHLSTTIWHQPCHNNSLLYGKGARPVQFVGFIDKALMAPFSLANWVRKQAWEKTKMAANIGWKATRWSAHKGVEYGKRGAHYGLQGIKSGPVHTFLSPISYAYGKIRAAIDWTLTGTETGIRTSKEVGLGIVNTRNSIARGLGEPALGPLYAAKHLVIDTNIKLAKDVVKTPINILKVPQNFIGAAKESIGDIRTDTKNVFSNIKNLEPINALKNTGKGIWHTLQAPFKMADRTARPILEAPINYLKNWGTTLYKFFPERVAVGIQHIRGGIGRILNSYNTAKEETNIAKGIRASSRQERKTAREGSQQSQSQAAPPQ